jgi:hypothetical protein
MVAGCGIRAWAISSRNARPMAQSRRFVQIMGACALSTVTRSRLLAAWVAGAAVLMVPGQCADAEDHRSVCSAADGAGKEHNLGEWWRGLGYGEPLRQHEP